jgi:precorrin isomerase
MKAFIHRFLANPMSGPEIEARSFACIDAECTDGAYSRDQWEVVRRMIHTAGDLKLASEVRFTADAVGNGVTALQRGAPLYLDSNMIRAGLSLERLRRVRSDYSAEQFHCCVADADVVRQAQQARLPRSLFAVRKSRAMLDGGIAVFGNAPVALLELNRMIIEEGVRPALVIGLPVGFVHVCESKEELMGLPVPSIVIPGRRGGSPLAVSVVHALCACAERAASTQTAGANQEAA